MEERPAGVDFLGNGIWLIVILAAIFFIFYYWGGNLPWIGKPA